MRYDPATNKWATLPSPKHAYRYVGGVLYEKLYLVGGQTEMYDPATNRWTDKGFRAPMPWACRGGHTGQAVPSFTTMITRGTPWSLHPLSDAGPCGTPARSPGSPRQPASL